ncbi:hypothetical protein O7608_26180 [Solwaraspora sp. WMMA2056]|uniref:hypothetical protein n=1 Tax=Solwaraspora sp. WMMA2056 TaxID=3015161 RepID=UPI00259B5EC5|nr:hypothetical protein [Solwaraspora sp. WMMA2056]WJK39890.1 hypothetical protein O7608_26180 [Solwaraspora sp. WMMA2056]
MPVVERGLHHDTEVLLRRVDGLAALLRLRHPGPDAAMVEPVVEALGALVVNSASASAADRARVRATVHYYMVLAGRGGLLQIPAVAAVRPTPSVAPGPAIMD